MLNKSSLIFLRFITLTLMVMAGLFWGILGVSGVNIISRTARLINMPNLSRVFYVLMGLATVIFIIFFYNRDTFLPFLGETVVPSSLINVSQPLNADYQVDLEAPNQAKYVIYWASTEDDVNVKEAYGNYQNAGASQVHDNKAIIRVKSPTTYSIGGKEMARHIHYRWIYSNAMMSRVHTLYI